MTMKPKARKFRIRRDAPTPAARPQPAETNEDGFGDAPFPGSAKAEEQPGQVQDIAEIREEGLTGRQYLAVHRHFQIIKIHFRQLRTFIGQVHHHIARFRCFIRFI